MTDKKNWGYYWPRRFGRLLCRWIKPGDNGYNQKRDTYWFSHRYQLLEADVTKLKSDHDAAIAKLKKDNEGKLAEQEKEYEAVIAELNAKTARLEKGKGRQPTLEEAAREVRDAAQRRGWLPS